MNMRTQKALVGRDLDVERVNVVATHEIDVA
jgi:hypothetical protein